MQGWTPEERDAWLAEESHFPAPRFAEATRPRILIMPPPLQDQIWEEEKRKKIEEQERLAREEEEQAKIRVPVREPGRLYGRSLMDELLERQMAQKQKQK
jgi:hypothetical protein